jgi:L,D-transpeptidase ErfK/SrfK
VSNIKAETAGRFGAFARASVVLLGSVALSACSLFGEPFGGTKTKPEVQPKAAAEPQRVGLPPLATHHFTLDPAQDDVVGLIQKTIATSDDTLPDIARRFNLGYEEIVRANPDVDPWLPGAGREINLPTRFILPNAPREGIVINIPAMRLFYFPAHEKEEPATVFTYPVGVGRVGWVTPEGTTKIIRRTLEPTWTVPPSIRKEHAEMGEELPPVVPPGPDNPLGRHSFTLGWVGYLVHGTNKPYGVGMRSSHGCIRLYPEDIAHLFDTVPLGTQVRVVNQPLLFGRAGDDVLMQPVGALEDDPRDWANNGRKLMEKSVPSSVRRLLKEKALKIDWDHAHELSKDARGVPVSILAPDANVDGELLAARQVWNEVPEGANWDGVVTVDEAKFQELLSDRETAPDASGTAP